MSADILPNESFDLKLAIECATAYADATGLGCTVSDLSGKIFHTAGQGCGNCNLCEMAGEDHVRCMRAHAYGMTEAERFGGKYIYFCPMGLTCFVSPIVGQSGSAAKITVGPFLMVDAEDYVEFDLKQKNQKIDAQRLKKISRYLERVPYVSPGRVNSMSILLFMSVGFMNDVSAASRMLETQDADEIQSQISEYILELKGEEAAPQYPLATERALLSSIVDSDKPTAQKLLNELLGHILFSSGGDFARIKSRMYELLVLISRAAVDSGASPDHIFSINHRFFQQAQSTVNIDELCFLLADVMNRFIDSVFEFSDVKHVDVIYKAVQYMRRNCATKVSLDDVARMVFLSPSYFSRVFKKEMGCNFNTYLNRLRIEKSKRLLLSENIRLVDIATMVGFEDQSYFTKVFKRVTGLSPNRFRENGGRI